MLQDRQRSTMADLLREKFQTFTYNCFWWPFKGWPRLAGVQ